ncbi:tetratricopeptide repeat protein [bacterium]|nr:tetratricopeptide repeat protein [bacterium]
MTRKLGWNPVLIVFVVAFVVYIPSLFGGFVYDDHYEILGDGFMRQSNPWLSFALNKWDLLSLQNNAPSPYYRPVPRILLWICYQLAGPQPFLFHLNNVFCHALNCALLTYLSWRYFRSSRVALVSGLLFALHPRHVEPVAWPAAICEVFCWTGLLFYLVCADRAASPGRGRWWLGAFLGLLLAGLSKESGILAGGLGFLSPILNLPQRPAADRRRGVIGVLAVCVAAVAVYTCLRVGIAHVSMPSTQAEPFLHRLTQGVYVFSALAGLAVWPFGYGLFRGPFLNANPTHWEWWLSLLGLLLYGLSVLYTWRRHRGLCFGLLWWGYLAAPVTGVAAPLPSLLSDRHIYPGLAAWCWLWGLLAVRFDSRLLRGGLLTLAVMYTLITWQQIRVWCDEVALWRQSKAHCPTNTIPRDNLGAILLEQGRLREAAAEYEELIRFGPELEDGYLGFARTQMAAKDPRGAEATLAFALKRGVKPDLSLRETLGEVLVMQQRFDAAVEVFARCLSESPDRLSLRFSLANALVSANRFEDARREYQAILERYDRSLGTRHNLQLLDLKEAEYCLAHGQRARAEECLRRLLSDPQLDLQVRQHAQQLLKP